MSLATDFTINYGAKTVTHTANADVYTVLDFFKWLATTFAEASQMDDDYPFVSDTPTVFRWVNGWAMGDDVSYKYLSGGSVESSDGDDLFANLYSIGDQFRYSMIYIIQDGTEVTPWWSQGNIDIVIKVKSGGLLIDSGNVLVMSRDTDNLYDHNITNLAGGGRNPVGINTFEDLNYKETGDIYLAVASVTGFTIGNYVKGATSTATGRIQYVDTPNNRLYLCQVENTFVISEVIDETDTRGGAPAGASTTNDGTTAEFSVIRGYSDVKIAFVQRKFEGGTPSIPFVVGETLTQAVSGWTGRFVATVANVLFVENTANTPNGTDQITGSTSGATYTPTSTSAATSCNKDLNNGAGLKPYNCVVDGAGHTMQQVYQYLKYVCAHNSLSTLNALAGEVYRSCSSGTYTDSKQAPFGTFAGGTFFGARGVWVEDYAAATFQLIDANGASQLPPNYQKASVAHANLSGCRILIACRTGAAVIKNQYVIDTANGNSITVVADIDINKTPQSGNLRVADTQYAYTGFSGKVFTGVTPDPSAETGDLYVPLLDIAADSTSELSDNIIYGAAFDVKARVRKYGFKDFELDTSFGSGGLAVTPILATDPQAT